MIGKTKGTLYVGEYQKPPMTSQLKTKYEWIFFLLHSTTRVYSELKMHIAAFVNKKSIKRNTKSALALLAALSLEIKATD